MSESGFNTLELDKNYTAQERDSFVNTKDIVLLSPVRIKCLQNRGREYKVTHEFKGFFEHSSEDGEKYNREKKASVVEKV